MRFSMAAVCSLISCLCHRSCLISTTGHFRAETRRFPYCICQTVICSRSSEPSFEVSVGRNSPLKVVRGEQVMIAMLILSTCKIDAIFGHLLLLSPAAHILFRLWEPLQGERSLSVEKGWLATVFAPVRACITPSAPWP